MSAHRVFHCIVDDTALITNISEIKTWISQGIVTLVIPLYSRNSQEISAVATRLTRLALERLNLLKKDSSQIGINAREAVKFLDRVTSGKDGPSQEAITLQGPDEEYKTWDEVEEHLVKEEGESESTAAAVDKVPATQTKCTTAEQVT